jgi:hypothetical protein
VNVELLLEQLVDRRVEEKGRELRTRNTEHPVKIKALRTLDKEIDF